jgi:hypothetical protein
MGKRAGTDHPRPAAMAKAYGALECKTGPAQRAFANRRLVGISRIESGTGGRFMKVWEPTK